MAVIATALFLWTASPALAKPSPATPAVLPAAKSKKPKAKKGKKPHGNTHPSNKKAKHK